MQRPALYFPYIHIRDDNWLKAAALYWPTVRRIVPHNYPKHDSATAAALAGEGVLRDVNPGWAMFHSAQNLVHAIESNVDAVAQQYGLPQAYEGPNRSAGRHVWETWQDENLAWIHFDKFPDHLVDVLVGEQVAIRGRGQAQGPTNPNDWIGLHPALAGAYMTALAGQISEQSSFEPLTDQTDLRVATPNSDVRAALQLLLGRQVGHRLATSADGTESYVMLALEQVLPEKLGTITPAQVVECRTKLKEELTTFRNYVEDMQKELVQLAQIPNELSRIEAFTQHVEETIEQPLAKLERGMKLLKIPSTRSVLTASTVAPPAIVGEAVHHFAGASAVAAATAGVATLVGTAWWSVAETRAAAKEASPVGYLLDVRDKLTPKTVLNRARRIVTGTYG